MRFRVDRSAQEIGSRMTTAPPTIADLQPQGADFPSVESPLSRAPNGRAGGLRPIRPARHAGETAPRNRLDRRIARLEPWRRFQWGRRVRHDGRDRALIDMIWPRCE